MKNLNIVVFILALLNTLESLSIDLYLPAFPSMAQIFNTDIGHIQISISVFFAGFAFGQLLWGPLSDKKGRKPMLYCGLLLFIVGATAIFFTSDIYVLWAMRFLQAFGGSAGIVIGRAIIIDLYDKQKSVTIFSQQSQISGIAPIVAPLLGSVFLKFWGWNSSFAFLVIMGIITLFMVYRYVPETNAKISLPDQIENEKGLKDQLKMIITNKDFINSTMIGSIAFASLIIYISNAPFLFMEIHGFSSGVFSFIFAFNSLALITAAYITPKLIKRISNAKLLLIATLVLLCVCALHILIAAGNLSVGLEIAMLYLSLLAIGILFPITSAHALSPFKEGRGTAAALLGFMQLMVTFLMSALIGFLEADSIMPMVIARTGIAVIAVWFGYRIFKTQKSAA
ncbi:MULTISPECIES: multidrug effflux MFS transporter [Chryseobacterium]|uniref:MFS transporter n=1 Tax=Chryseobacterium rhizosphaerae TaxID=395937 RepID=A0AAE3YAS0_9FLAO|nr:MULTISPECIES: multidrug effflux MFS transporter [Chryseobacterium]MBL3550057.1 multidrug effflux MFS transporter [Chryseobacterium sp. KMC2]MDR6526718.1 DHA1 family bicyclomycin/chloramphenicol resistance-like MFS transporter [Chryseobacterium rhizosphaerae]REC74102.1 MFS transporter [Chryseobacterium rhizosphaerae]SMC73695.1 MFS transporter, DHA1 family, bicyclomycin/chloramphenicol resistance protein [Chryseobacterium sp. YR221]GEN69004.1 Bcr/CflA family drug resistance efflux transporter